jgi:hypothetical protein
MPTGDETPPLAGYFAGGYDGSNNISGIDKIAFPADTKSTLSATLTSGRLGAGGVANSGVAGYIGGGYINATDTFLSDIDKIAFPADTKSTLSATLSVGRYSHGSMANSGTAGYFGGGYGSDTGGRNSSIDKLSFSAETRSTLSATLTAAVSWVTAMANSGTAGYFCGGATATGTVSTIDKITFSADTKSTLSASLSSARQQAAGMANSGTAGYVCGGEVTLAINGIDKLSFSAETRSTLSATLTSNNRLAAAMAHSGTAGYIGGGYNDSTNLSGIDKITFSTDAKSTLSATLTSVSRGNTGFADSGVL